MTTDIAALRKRAMYDPQSLTKEEWLAIHKVATTVPKKEFFDDDNILVRAKRKKKDSWW